MHTKEALDELMRGLKEKTLRLPADLLRLLRAKARALRYSAKLMNAAQAVPFPQAAARRLKADWQRQLQADARMKRALTAEEAQIAARIGEQTARGNLNNVTRTRAYWELYRELPELHWALLAHMVSRNGGWAMTDLRGDMLPRLLGPQQTESIFAFLERANGLIFQDAYPQLLLYRESRRQGRSLFHLLPHFRVSAFMEPVWQQFWRNRESVPLTVSLIINEQHYIEKRIVQHEYYKKHVLDTLLFKTQAWLQLNQVFFPYYGPSRPGLAPAVSPRLAGLVLESFGSLKERIEFGKQLYAMLYGIPPVREGVLAFARRQPHTGSRADYCPQLFAAERKASPETKFQERLDGCRLKQGAAPYYSPRLEQAWPNRKLAPAEPGDWFVDLKPLAFIKQIAVPFPFDMTAEACAGLNKIELAVLAEQALLR